MQELDFQIRGKNYSSIFASKEQDENDKPEVRLSIHIFNATCSTKMSMEAAKKLLEALKEIVESE